MISPTSPKWPEKEPAGQQRKAEVVGWPDPIRPPAPQAEPAIDAFVRSRQPDVVSYSDWDTIDRHEREQGRRVGCPRVKLTRVSDMIDVVQAAERLSA